MIIVYHQQELVTRIYDVDLARNIELQSRPVAPTLVALAQKFPDRILAWCNSELEDFLDFRSLPQLLATERTMLSFSAGKNYLDSAIGYVEETPALSIKKEVRYPTWQMSADGGAIYGKTLQMISTGIQLSGDFGYFLNSIAKLAAPFGLFCYSEPRIFINLPKISSKPADDFTLFKFVRQHYKITWVFLLLLNMFLYERRAPVIAAFRCLFFRRRRFSGTGFPKPISDGRKNADIAIDVLIPTIGRKKYLRDVLDDLSAQTLLPQKVIIVEQNPLPESASELDYLSGKWPFEIRHIFTHRTGACNARNRGLEEVSSDWLFFADDDIRLKPDFLEKTFNNIESLKGGAFNICCLNPGNLPEYENIHQTSIFGAGCSIVSRNCLDETRFDLAFEFGFGEDSDFGKQLINKGFDIIYLPEPAISHLKAPIGGFRTKPRRDWDDDELQPKPSPTVMLFKRKHLSTEQLNGYKTALFLKFYRHQSVRNPFSYLKKFREQWQRSIYWSDKLIAESKTGTR